MFGLLSRTLGGWALASLLLAGCGGPAEPPRYPISGAVKFNGHALPEATVSFHPTDPAADVRPFYAVTDAQGRFSVTFRTAGDGAPAGNYRVTVVRNQAIQDGDELLRNGPNELPARYAAPETSGLTATIVAGMNELPAFLLEN